MTNNETPDQVTTGDGQNCPKPNSDGHTSPAPKAADRKPANNSPSNEAKYNALRAEILKKLDTIDQLHKKRVEKYPEHKDSYHGFNHKQLKYIDERLQNVIVANTPKDRNPPLGDKEAEQLKNKYIYENCVCFVMSIVFIFYMIYQYRHYGSAEIKSSVMGVIYFASGAYFVSKGCFLVFD